ncbi:MAG TPA: hypothetical protein VF444_14125 [Pseudonocardiaceae bacterium]
MSVIDSEGSELEPRSHGVGRRGFLRSTGMGVLTVVVAGTGVISYRAYDNRVLDPDRGTAFDAWRNWRDDPGPRGVIAAAILAASPHNIQPWLFQLNGNRVDVHADTARRMVSVDPYSRERNVGLGCAVENMMLAARARGMAPTCTLRPDAAQPALVARVDLGAGSPQPSELHDAIGNRHSNRGPYTADAVDQGTLSQLGAVADPTADAPATVAWVTGDARNTLGQLMIDAAKAVTADQDQSRDGFVWFRSSASDIERYKDGLTLDGQGLSAALTSAAKMLPASSRQEGDQFWVDQTRTVHTATAAAYGFVLVPDPHDPVQQLTGGRLLQRIHLAITAHGLGMQHMNQITERIDRDQSLNRSSPFAAPLAALVSRPGSQVLATFRLGHPQRDPRLSPRRPVSEVLR